MNFNKMKDIIELINFGIINIDKPIGPTSFSISNYVRREFNLNKTSHLGTLDPKVSGVLPIALGRACKLAGFLIGNDKKYVGILHTHKEQDINELQRIINIHFLGKIKQIPPHKSAVKREERIREVFDWKLLEYSETKKDFLFYCKVQGGTYIRKLCSDLGEYIEGAHMSELRRTKAGYFDEEKMYTLYELDEAILKYKKGDDEQLKNMIIPAIEIIKKKFKIIYVKKEVVKSLLTGKPLLKNHVLDLKQIEKLDEGEKFAIFEGEKFIEIAKKVTQNSVIAKSLFVYN